MSTIKVLTTSSAVLLNGENIAVSAFSVNYGLNAISSASFNLALGQGFAVPAGTKQTKVVNPGAIKSGDTVQIYHWQTLGGNTIGGLIFDGVVTGISSSRGEGGTGIAVNSTVSCSHRLALLGGLPTLARAYILQSSSQRVYDTYRGAYGNIAGAYGETMSGLLKTSTEEKENVGEFIVGCLRALYESEGEDTKNNNVGRKEMPEALATLNSLQISPKMKIDNPQGYAPNRVLKFWIARVIAEGWKDSNGLQLLINTLNALFAGLIPTAKGGYLAPVFPLSKIPSVTVSSADIFNLRKETEISTQPTAGVRMLGQDYTQDAGMAAMEQGSVFVQYPPGSDTISGIYEYVSVPAWAQLVRHFFEVTPAPPADVKEKANPGGKADLVEKPAAPLDPDKASEYMLNIAKTIFMSKKWSKNSLEMSLPFTFNAAPGAVVEINLQGTSRANNLFGGTKLFGQILSVSISASYTNVACTARVGFVRNAEDNEKYGFEEHPLYMGYRMERLKLY